MGGANNTAGLQKSSQHPSQEEAQTLGTHLFQKEAFISASRAVARAGTRTHLATLGRGKAARRDAWVISPPFLPEPECGRQC